MVESTQLFLHGEVPWLPVVGRQWLIPSWTRVLHTIRQWLNAGLAANTDVLLLQLLCCLPDGIDVLPTILETIRVQQHLVWS